MTELPLDIKTTWFNVIRRLQSTCAKQTGGIAVIDIRVVVDANGDPIAWTSPNITMIEPKSRAQEILDLLIKQ